MPNANVARGLNVGSDVRALTFTELQPTISEAFHDNNVFWDSQYINITELGEGASSDDFPFFGDSPEDAEHHVAGQFIQGGTIVQNKVNIAVDDPLIKALRLPFQDQALSRWDLISPYAKECARIVAEKQDNRAAVVGLKAARTAAVTNVHGGGHTVTRTSTATLLAGYPVNDTGAQNFADDLADMAESFDNQNVPDDGNRFCFISPFIRKSLTRSNRFVNRDYTNAADGDITQRHIGTLEGFKIVLTRHLPSTNITTDLSKYNADFTNATGLPAALCLYNGEGKGAIGGVQKGGVTGTVYWDENREVWLVKVRAFTGIGVVEPWAAGEIRVTA